MSVGHLYHILLTVYSSMEHVTWKSPGTMLHGGHMLHRAVNSQQDVIKISSGHQNVVIR